MPDLIQVDGATATRTARGSIHVTVQTTVPTAGWEVSAQHKIAGDTVEVWAHGVPPEDMAAQVICSPELQLDVQLDGGSGVAVKRVIVHGRNGSEEIHLTPGSG